jgi:hypothetical protein
MRHWLSSGIFLELLMRLSALPDRMADAVIEAKLTIDHPTGKVLVYVLGRGKDIVFLKLNVLLEPYRITQSYTDE